MCIICSCESHPEPAEEFLQRWQRSQAEMRAAADAMLRVSQVVASKDDRRRYDRMHKQMVRTMRAWNRLEMLREAELEAKP